MRNLVPVLSPDETEEFKRLNAIVQRTKQSTWEFLSALAEIKDKQLWRADYDTWEAYCEQQAGLTRQRVGQLIRALKFREEQKRIPGAVVPKTEREARQMMEEEQNPVTSANLPNDGDKIRMETVVSNNTSSKNKDSSLAPPPPEEDELETEGKDRMGYPVPKEIWPLFHRWHEAQKVLDQLRALRLYIEEKKQRGDRLYAHLSSNWPSSLDQSIEELKQSIPYAVCVYCQGRNYKNCTNCRGTGFMGKFAFDHTAMEELRTMRQMEIKNKK